MIEERDPQRLGAVLADRVAADLRAAISAGGRARLAVPGGTTPAPFLRALGAADLDWERVAVTLTDERWVPVSDPRSNQGLLADTLFSGPAAGAEFVPLYGATAEPAQSLDAIAAALGHIALPLDVVVAGMGADMHTASLFPGAVGLAEALSDAAPPVVAITAPGAMEPRITLSAPVLRQASRRYLLIHGPAKRAALERAGAADGAEAAPVRVLLDAPGGATVCYAAGEGRP
ncbi:MAG: 6-phosphogluconolactonase [Pseudomonadota bacterium]